MTLKKIAVGKIVATHGIKGEVKVLIWTDFPQRFRPGTELLIQQEGKTKTVIIRRARISGRHLILKLDGVSDLDHARSLKGAVLEVERWEVEPLPEDRYYHFQLIGSRVFTVTGKYLGNLTDILTTGANDVFVVRDEKNAEILIPALKTVVCNVNLGKGEIRVQLPPGLLD